MMLYKRQYKEKQDISGRSLEIRSWLGRGKRPFKSFLLSEIIDTKIETLTAMKNFIAVSVLKYFDELD